MAASMSQANHSVSGDHGLVYPLNAALNCLANINQSTLSFLPVIGLLFSCYGLCQGHHAAAKIKFSRSLLGAKIVTASCLIAIEYVTIATWMDLSNQQHQQYQQLLPAIVSCLAAATVTLEHLYAASSTAAVALSLAVSAQCDWTRLQSHLSQPALHQLKTFAILAFGFKCMLLVLSELPKVVSEEEPPNRSLGPKDVAQQSSAGFWTRTLFGAFCTQSISPVTNNLGQPLSAESLYADFQARKARGGSYTQYCLLFALVQPITMPLMKILALGLSQSAFTLSQATFFRRFFAFADEPDKTLASKYGLLAILTLMHYGIATLRSLGKDRSSRVSQGLQTALTGLVQQKLASLPFSDIQTQRITATVNGDIGKISDAVFSCCSILCDFVEVVVCGRWFIQSLGHIAVLIQGAIILYLMLLRHFGDRLNVADRALNESTSTRITKASNMLAKIKLVQMVGLTNVLTRVYEKYRAYEAGKYMKVAKALSSRVKIAESFYAAPSLCIMGILHFKSPTGQVAAQEAFFILATVYLHFDALFRSVQSGSNIHVMLYGIDRMQTFLSLEEATDLTLLDRHSGPSSVEPPPGEKTMAKPAMTQSATTANVSLVDRVIDIQAASLTSHSAKNKSIIKKLTLSVERHELVMVAGPAGCGKSTLLRSLIGDGVRKDGKFWREPGNAGYCDHHPWLQHASIQQNIIGRDLLDMEWYDAVLDACLLTQDLHNLANGDRTIIGSTSSNLSHGQEHKVALARALYMKAPFLILDGVFSVLDSDTASKIFARIFGEGGLLDKSPSTVVLTTHSKVLLSKADKVVLLDASGKATVHTDVDSIRFRQHLDTIDLSEYDSKSRDKRRYSHTTQLDCTVNWDETDEESGMIDQLYIYLCTFNGWGLAYVLVLMLLSALGVSFREYAIHRWLTLAPESSHYFLGCVVFTAATSMMMMHGASVWYLRVSPSTANNLHKGLLDSTMQAGTAYLARTPHQTLLNLYGADMKALTRQMPRFFLLASHKLFTTLLQAIMIAALVNQAYFVLGTLAFGMTIAVVGYCRSARRIQLAMQKNKAAKNASLADMTSGSRHIRAFGWHAQTLQKHSDLLQESQVCAFELQSTDRWLELVMDLTKGASSVALVATVIFNDSETPKSITAVMMLALVICSDNFVLFARYIERLRSCLRSLNRVHRSIKAMKRNPEVSPDVKGLPKDWPAAGNVVLKSVTASYDAKSLVPPVLKMLTVSIPSGYKVAIVGRSGSGKSSLLLSLLNFLDVEGSIEIDKVDTSTLPANFVRQHISTISTEVIELEGTVRANICPWTIGKSEQENSIHSQAIYLVLRTLGLWRPLKRNGGLDTDITALDFSHEERQLLSVARGMLYNLYVGSNLVLMDETDNDLDPMTEMIVHNTMKQVFDDHTVIRVMSRPDFLKDTDMTIRMLGGRISEVTVNSQGPAAIKETGKEVDRGERKRYQEAAQRRTAEQQAAKQQASKQQATARRAATQQAATQRAATQRIATQGAATQQATEQQASTLRTATLRAATLRAAEQRAAEQRAATQRVPAQQAAEQSAAEQSAAEQSAAEQSAAEQIAATRRVVTQQAAEQRAAAQQAAEQRTTLQRGATPGPTEQRAATRRVATASGSSTATASGSSTATASGASTATASGSSTAAASNRTTPRLSAMEAFYRNLMYVTDNPDAEPLPGPHQASIEDLRYANEVRLQWERRSLTAANLAQAEVMPAPNPNNARVLLAARRQAHRATEEGSQGGNGTPQE